MADLELAEEIVEAIARLLLRRNRSAVYDILLESANGVIDRHTYPMLTGISRLGPMSAASIAELVGIDRSGASRYADKLQSAGLTQRCPDPQDRRATLISLTEKGRASLGRATSQTTAFGIRKNRSLASWTSPRVY